MAGEPGAISDRAVCRLLLDMLYIQKNIRAGDCVGMKKWSALTVCAFLVISTFGLIGFSIAYGQQRAGNAIVGSASLLFGTTSSSSLNWAGYAVTAGAGSVTSVSGSFVVPDPPAVGHHSASLPAIPYVNGAMYKPGNGRGGTGGGGGSSQTSYAAFWAGIDGYNSNTVEQAGVLLTDTNGVASYSVWYEFYPAAPVYATWSPNVGDSIAVYVNYSASSGAYIATVVDLTLHMTYVSPSTAVSGSQRSSAEWIAEAPSSARSILPLADFVSVSFGSDYTGVGQTNYAAVSGISGSIGTLSATFTTYQVNMVKRNGALKAQTSALSSGGTSFTVAWMGS